MHQVVTQGIERKAIFKYDMDREDFIERLSRLLQEMDADAIGRYLGIKEKDLARPTAWRPGGLVMTRNCLQPPKRYKENSKIINIETTSL